MQKHQPQTTQQTTKPAAHATPRGSAGETVSLKVGDKDDLFKRQTNQVLQRVKGEAVQKKEGGKVEEIIPKKESVGKTIEKKPAEATKPPTPGGEAVPVKTTGAKAKTGEDDLLMPPAPTNLSPAAQKRLTDVQQKAGAITKKQAALPSAASNVSTARGAVKEPGSETKARAGGAIVTAFAERQPPSPEVEKLCTDIRKAIRDQRPADEESLVKTEPKAAAKQAGKQLDSSIQNNAQQAQGGYDQMQSTPQGTPQLQPQAMDAPPVAVQTAPPGAQTAVPDPVPDENISLDADVAASEKRMQDAGMNSEPAKLVQEGPIAEARAAKGELAESAKLDPAKVMAEQNAALANASADMLALQASAMESLQTARAGSVHGVTNRRQNMVESEEQTRTRVGKEAQTIFESAQKKVNDLLKPLPEAGMKKWDAGIKIASEKFKSRLKKVEDTLKERHSEFGGFFVGIWDDVTGLPGWVTTEYNTAEREFGDDTCALIREISSDVNTVIASCESIISEARTQIDKLFSDLPDNLKTWAAGEQARFAGQLDQLQKQATDTRNNFTKDLVNRAATAVQDVREKIHALREKAKGLIGRLKDAVGRFLDDPLRFIINGLLSLVGIAPATFWALIARIKKVIKDLADDPKKFANNLMKAIGKGFTQFFDNIGKHLLTGLLDWLTSGLKSVGVSLPKDFSLKSIITFFLELMGISWARIRKLVAKRIGEKNVALIEKAFSIISNLIQMGPTGIFELLKDKLDPQNILKQVMDAAISFLIEAIIKKVTLRIIAMFNPVGAIVQAIEAIYRVLKWIFDNAARIFTLVESIVDGIGNIIAGNIGGMANVVEKALVRIIAPVIDFLAGFLGFGDLPDKIAKVIKGFQDWIEGILDTVIGWLVEQGKKLIASVAQTGAPQDPNERLEKGMAIAKKSVDAFSGRKISKSFLTPIIGVIKMRYQFQSLDLFEREGKWALRGQVNPIKEEVTSAGVIKVLECKVNPPFKRNPDHDEQEFNRQLDGQRDGINRLSVRGWLNNRDAFIARQMQYGSGRDPASKNLQRQFREREKVKKIQDLVTQGISYAKAEEEANRWIKTQAALHDPDQIAGGEAAGITSLGDARINSSIGRQWKDRIKSLDDRVRDEVKDLTFEEQEKISMRVQLK